MAQALNVVVEHNIYSEFQPLSQSAARDHASQNAQLSAPIKVWLPNPLHGCSVFCSSAPGVVVCGCVWPDNFAAPQKTFLDVDPPMTKPGRSPAKNADMCASCADRRIMKMPELKNASFENRVG